MNPNHPPVLAITGTGPLPPAKRRPTPSPSTSTRQSPITVEWERPKCPDCGGYNFQTVRSLKDQGDGTSMRMTRCRGCNCYFELVLK